MAEPKRYFPTPRGEILTRLTSGDQALDAAMRQNSRSCARGDILVRAGEPHDIVYRLVSGTAARVRVLEDGRRQIICFFLPGDLIGVKAMLLDRQPDSIECLSPAVVHALACPDAIALLSSNSEVAFRFMWQLADDERRLHNKVAMLGRGTAAERIATMLVDVTGRLAILGMQHEPPRMIPIRQADVADYLGLTPVHVNRILRALASSGTVAVSTTNITILDVEAIGRLAAPMLDIFEREAPEFGGRV